MLFTKQVQTSYFIRIALLKSKARLLKTESKIIQYKFEKNQN
mgnify:CR=1 FL=1|jgi:hypothetical protein